MKNSPEQITGFKPFKKGQGRRPVATPVAPKVTQPAPRMSPGTLPASPHMNKHRPQPGSTGKPLIIPGATAEAPFGFDENGRALSVTEFANRRIAQQDPTLPQVQVPQQQVAQTAPAVDTVRKYGEPVALTLPSSYVFNRQQFSALYIRPIRGYTMSLFASAWANRSKRQEVEAASSVLESDNPDLPKPLGYYLTLGDYYWLLYKLRFANYRRPIKHVAICNNPKHQAQVREKTADQKSLRIEVDITQDMMQERSLNILPKTDPDIMFSEELGREIVLRPATMLDMIETLEHPQFGKNARWDYLSQIACYLVGDTYDQRMELANMLSPDQIEHLQGYERVLSGFGMVESVEVTCPHCGHTHTSKVTIDASTFLPG